MQIFVTFCDANCQLTRKAVATQIDSHIAQKNKKH